MRYTAKFFLEKIYLKLEKIKTCRLEDINNNYDAKKVEIKFY